MSSAAIDDLRAYLDASPSPFHAVHSSIQRLRAAGFIEVSERDAWEPVERGYVARGGALIAWSSAALDPTASLRIVGAHTDSPGLRIKPNPDTGHLGWRQLAVEVYGGILNNSWLDRDLGVAGRLVLADASSLLFATHDAVARVPQLAVHLDRDVNEKGLVLDKQQHLTPIWGTGSPSAGGFRAWLAETAGIAPQTIAGWELQLFDVTPAAIIGADQSLLASGRLDNQLSSWAATSALCSVDPSMEQVAVMALFDHEEVGSDSTTGAGGPLLQTVLERLVSIRGGDREAMHRAFAASMCVSSDNAHAVHPNYSERHEPGHRPLVNHGPAIKYNSNQRYATDAITAAAFQRACRAVDVPVQQFVSRNNMPCGSTIGPITAARLGIDTVDVGVPQLSMHSARELCGVNDPVWLAAALGAFLAGA